MGAADGESRAGREGRPAVATEYEAQVREAIRAGRLADTYRRLIAGNDARILQPDLDNARELVRARSAAHTVVAGAWVAEQHRVFGYDKPFALVALGGTGRAEMTPGSDVDFAFLFDDVIEGNAFLMELQRRILHGEAFEEACGFRCRPLPFNLDDAPRLTDKQLNAFTDLRPLYDLDGLAARFRERIRATYDPFQHFLHVRRFWTGHWEKAAGESERLDRFDIKNEGLRVFLAGIWALAGREFRHSHEVYQELEDSRDLRAYEFLLRIRAFVHLQHRRRPPAAAQNENGGDVLGFDDFTGFGAMLGPEADEQARFEFDNEVRSRLLEARRRVARFTKAVIERELKTGRPVSSGSPLVYGVGGLFHSTAAKCATPREKSRAALSLLWASQRYGVPIDPCELQATFRNAGDWLMPVPELASLFYEPEGSLADSFAFLSQFEGAEDRLFPGYRRFECSLDVRVMKERTTLRGALERQKLRVLEGFVRQGRERLAQAVSAARLTDFSSGVQVEVEAALLDADHLAAIKLALKTKRLPLTPDDLAVRRDPERPAHERLSTGMSEVPLSEYYERYGVECDFTPETVRVTEFLIANRRAFKTWAETGLNDPEQVAAFARLCENEDRLRALFVFTCADRAEWESAEEDPVRWFNSRELYEKTMLHFRPGLERGRLIEQAGYSGTQLAILKDFGVDFFGGIYRQYANRFGSHLVRLVEEHGEPGPKVSVLREGTSVIVGVAARDYRGLAATISGALWRRRVGLAQAHFFSAMHHGLALDFFHLAPGGPVPGRELQREVEEAIRERRHIETADEAALPALKGSGTLQAWRSGQYCLRFEIREDRGGVLYALAYKVFRHLHGNIFGLVAHAVRGASSVAVYLSLPAEMSLDEARRVLAERF